MKRHGPSLAVPMVAALTLVSLYTMTAPAEAGDPGLSTSSAESEKLRIEHSVYYSGCREARAAGVAPIYEGQPGYREGMDGDDDGVACEPYHPYSH